MSKRARRQLAEDLPVWPEAVMGGKYARLLETQLEQLRDEAAHGNRELHLDDVFVVHWLAFFNPTIRSLRTIEDFSQTILRERERQSELARQSAARRRAKKQA